jgi:hypothetical protein
VRCDNTGHALFINKKQIKHNSKGHPFLNVSLRFLGISPSGEGQQQGTLIFRNSKTSAQKALLFVS